MRARRKAAPLAPLPRLSFSLESRLLVGICLLALALHAARASLQRGRLLAAASGVALGLGVLTKLWDVVAVVPVALYLAQPLLARLFTADGGKLRAAARAELVAPARDAARLLAYCAGGALAALVVVLLPFAASWPALYAQVVSFHLAAGRSTH